MATILLIDDSRSALSLAEQILTDAGHTVIAHQSARLLAQVAASRHFDLVITDIYMPDKDGLEVILELRKIRPQVPVIAMTGAEGVKDMREAARSMGAALTLRKPLTAAQLLQAVDSILPQTAESASTRDRRA